MGLTTPLDLATLTSWNILTDYTANKTAFVAAAKAVYQTLQRHSAGVSLGSTDLEAPLAVALQSILVFKKICVSKQHASPLLYGVFATALARYIIDDEWPNIIQP